MPAELHETTRGFKSTREQKTRLNRLQKLLIYRLKAEFTDEMKFSNIPPRTGFTFSLRFLPHEVIKKLRQIRWQLKSLRQARPEIGLLLLAAAT